MKFKITAKRVIQYEGFIEADDESEAKRKLRLLMKDERENGSDLRDLVYDSPVYDEMTSARIIEDTSE